MAKEAYESKPLKPPVAPAPVNGSAAPASRAPASKPAPVARKSGSWLGPIVGLLIVAAVAFAVYYFYFKPKPADGTDPAAATTAAGKGGKRGKGRSDKIVVVTAKAIRGDLGVNLVGLGSVTPLNTVTVKTRVDGQLMKVYFTEGQMVKQGDQLVQIDPRPYEAQLAQYKAQKEHDEALLDNAKIDEGRYETLLKQQSIAEQTLATQVALVKQDQGTVDSDDALIQQTQLNITYCNVTSPITGRVGLRLVDEGNQVHASDTTGLLVINQIQPINVIFTIPEDSVPAVMAKLNAGQVLPVDALDRAQKNKIADGSLQTTDNQIDPTTGTLKLKAIFPNTDKSLFPNQFVNAKLLVETKKDVVIVPVAAIQYGTQGTFAYVVSNGEDKQNATVEMKTIAVGTIDGDKAEITSGIDEGDVVVIDGVDKLTDKSKVIISNGEDSGGHSHGAPAAAASASSS